MNFIHTSAGPSVGEGSRLDMSGITSQGPQGQLQLDSSPDEWVMLSNFPNDFWLLCQCCVVNSYLQWEGLNHNKIKTSGPIQAYEDMHH